MKQFLRWSRGPFHVNIGHFAFKRDPLYSDTRPTYSRLKKIAEEYLKQKTPLPEDALKGICKAASPNPKIDIVLKTKLKHPDRLANRIISSHLSHLSGPESTENARRVLSHILGQFGEAGRNFLENDLATRMLENVKVVFKNTSARRSFQNLVDRKFLLSSLVDNEIDKPAVAKIFNMSLNTVGDALSLREQ